MKLTKSTILYTDYVVGTTLFFLYYLFPSEAVRDYVAYEISRGNPGIAVSIDHVSPVLPPGIKLNAVGIARGNNELFSLDSLVITPGLMSFFSSTKSARFTGRVNAGTVSGSAQADSRGDRGIEKVHGTLSGIPLQAIPLLQRLSDHKISGDLGGEFMIDGVWPERTMIGQLLLSNPRIDFEKPVIGLPSLQFAKVDADLAMNQGRLNVKKLSARGSQLDAELSGTIALRGTGRSNRLNINGSVTPHHGFVAAMKNSIAAGFLRQKKGGKTAISFTVGGTVAKPDFKLN